MDTDKGTAAPKGRIEELSENERRLLRVLLEEPDGLEVDEAAERLKLKPEHVRGAASWLASKGFAATEDETTVRLGLSEEGRRYASEGVPERRLFGYVRDAGGRSELDKARSESGLTDHEFGVALSWWSRKGLGRIEKEGDRRVLVAGEDPPEQPDEALLAVLDGADGADPGSVDDEGLELLRQRKGLVTEHESKRTRVRLADDVDVDRAVLDEAADAIEQITPDVIRSGAWRDRPIRPFDVSAPVPRAVSGKPHPLQQIIDEVYEIFLEMGFEEISYDYVQSTFWNMDALFIPQDHPARELQDTFYLDRPKRLPIPDDVVDQVAEVHETGGDTGSRGWGGRFDRDEARRGLLRTHTTVGTIRHLAANPDKPCRVFSVGRVFRSETMDRTHLPEFHQIEGIATEPGANFRQLVGILTEFYRRLGFEKVRVRPGYFPYTEPSMEVDVFYNGKWMELGGSGIFRPEVTKPLGVTTPVLAWGLGLERLAMHRLGLDDIRDLYISDLEWLRAQPLR